MGKALETSWWIAEMHKSITMCSLRAKDGGKEEDK